MSVAKIDLIELQQMFDDGRMSQKEMADYFGVDKSAITYAKRKLKRGVAANRTRTQLVGLINKKMSAVEQIEIINNNAHTLLQLYMGWIAGDKGSLAQLKAQIIRSKLNSTAQLNQEEQEEAKREAEEEAALFIKTKDPHDLAIKVMELIAKQLTLQLEITKTLYDMKATEEFQEEVLNAIGEIAPDVRAKIIERIQQRRAIRGVIK